MSSAGRRFATLMVFSQTRLIPTQKIKIFPTSDRLFNTGSVIIPASTTARAVTDPYRAATGIKEKMHPFPMDDAIINTIIKSRIPLATNVL